MGHHRGDIEVKGDQFKILYKFDLEERKMEDFVNNCKAIQDDKTHILAAIPIAHLKANIGHGAHMLIGRRYTHVSYSHEKNAETRVNRMNISDQDIKTILEDIFGICIDGTMIIPNTPQKNIDLV